MKRILVAVAALGLAGGLAACGKKQAAAPPPAPTTTAAPAAAPDAAPTGAATLAKGTGTVTATDPAAGTITLDHGPINEVNWPAMTMSFKAAPAVAQSVKVGDKIAFDLRVQDGAGEVTAIRKQ